MSYTELACTSSYSFLRGASPPSDYVAEGIRLGLTAIGIADRNTVSGVVRAWKALRDAPDEARSALLAAKRDAGEPETLIKAEDAACETHIRFLAGSRLVFSDGTPDIIAYPATRQGWGNLTRLLTVGNMRATKGSCILKFDDLLEHLGDLLLILMPYSTADEEEVHKNPPAYQFKESAKPTTAPSHLKLVTTAPQDWEAALRRLAPVHAGKLWIGISTHHRGKDKRQLARHRKAASALDVPLLATNDPLYASRDQRPLHDVVSCIRLGTTIQKAGFALEVNAERYIKATDEMEQLFRACPEALAETERFASQIAFDLEDLKYEYPHEPVPDGWTPDDWLAHLVWAAAHERYGAELPEKITSAIERVVSVLISMAGNMRLASSAIRVRAGGSGSGGLVVSTAERFEMFTARSPMRSRSLLILRQEVTKRRSFATGWCSASTLRQSSSSSTSRSSIARSPSITVSAVSCLRSTSETIALRKFCSTLAAR